VLAIDDKPDVFRALLELKAHPGRSVKLTFARAGQVSDALMKMGDFVPVPVLVRRVGRIGVLALSSFSDKGTTREVRRAIAALQRQSGGLEGLVLDLTDNGGGLLQESLGVANLFIAHGPLARLRDREEQVKAANPHRAIFRHLPLVVVTNNGSASAAEVVTAALKAHQRAVVVGRRTFGKGLVQSTFKLEDGSAVKITTERIQWPLGGQGWHRKGIAPDENTSAILESGRFEGMLNPTRERAIEILSCPKLPRRPGEADL
jgi:carboxyl-terminal processing protease